MILSLCHDFQWIPVHSRTFKGCKCFLSVKLTASSVKVENSIGCVALNCSEIFIDVTYSSFFLSCTCCIVSRTVHSRVEFKIMHTCWKAGWSVKNVFQASWWMNTVVDRSSKLLIMAFWEGILYLQGYIQFQFFFKNWFRFWQLNLFKMKLILSIKLVKFNMINIFIFTHVIVGEKNTQNS